MKHPKLLSWLLLQLCAAAMLQAASEESLKAAYMERFAMFIQWPHPIEKYTVCIYNDTSFASVLQKSYASRLFNNRPINVLSLNTGASIEELSSCHILYYRGAKPNQNTTQLNQLQKNNVLVISDNEDDAKKGGMIAFYMEKNVYRFIINQRNLENAHLTASYKLLNFATVIEATGGRDAR